MPPFEIHPIPRTLFDAVGYTSTTLLEYTSCNITNDTIKSSINDLAGVMANLLLLYFDTDFDPINVDTYDFGFLSF